MPTQGATAAGKTDTSTSINHYGGGTKFEFNPVPAGGTYTTVRMRLGKTNSFFRTWLQVDFVGMVGNPWRFTDVDNAVYTGVFTVGDIELT